MDSHILPEHYQRIFEALPGAFLLMLPDPDFTIAGVSDDYLRATLRQRADIVGRPVFEVFPDNPATPDANSTFNLARSLQRVVATGQADAMTIQRYDVPGGADGSAFEMRYWNPVNAPVFTADGTLLCIVHRVDNVTDCVRLSETHERQSAASDQLAAEATRMRAEIIVRSQELDRVNGELRTANEVLSAHARRASADAARKDEFLAMLAHELRNPLGAMSSALQLWTMVPADERRQQGLLEICRRQVRNLTRLADDLLEMSRIDRGGVELQRAPLDLRDIVENAMHAARDLFERRRLNVVTRIAPAKFNACADATRLEQALANLLTNAAKYSEPDGHIELTLEPIDAPAAGAADAGWARIVVRDEGRGIAPDKLDAIFDIFVQADANLDRSLGGLGIGLALVRAIVELHGGHVHAASDGIGKGSRFTVDLPLMSKHDRRRARQDDRVEQVAAVAQPPGQALRIAIVEDNADARDTLRALLATFGYDVSTAVDGDAGVALIVDARPDIAIVDIGLPGIDGFEVARRTRAATGSATRLVALSGYNSVAVQTAALDAGFDMHVAKPCTPAKLAEILGAPASE
jgi:signal transduction histidine kinase